MRASSLLTSCVLVVVPVVFCCGDCFGDSPPERLSIATWNVEWFFDADAGDNQSELGKSQSAPNAADWEWKRNEVARVIAALRPTIIALQEVENRRVIAELVQRLRDEHQLSYRFAFAEGGDVFTEQDVAILFQSGLTSYGRREQTRAMFDSNRYYNVQKHLFAEFQWEDGEYQEGLTMATVHFRARAEQEPIRIRQSRLMHEWLQRPLAAQQNVVLLGDLNTEIAAGEASPQNDLGTLLGLHTADASDDLLDLHTLLPPDQRATHLNGPSYDRIVVSRALVEDDPSRRDLALDRIRTRRDLVVRGNGPDANHFDDFYGIAADERDVSDHYPVVAEFVLK